MGCKRRIWHLGRFFMIIRLSGEVLMQGQLKKEAQRLKIIVSKFHNFPLSPSFQFHKSIPQKLFPCQNCAAIGEWENEDLKTFRFFLVACDTCLER
ncbi:hypothetical protein D8674_003848 [Pyrus ussuriensis x Pyrus communis]|uniref:Uncharacterized protein n=1 Tax=Pyrus ussuriensis x Pyrus communis TaxID=2448454 RepID=A0A5N5FIV4_9ROSA|nr:hypothetical protein D8674_003848 [Pyrus ussuriensis x Pyrus communis]